MCYWYIIIGSDNGLVPISDQAITLIDDDHDLWCCDAMWWYPWA